MPVPGPVAWYGGAEVCAMSALISAEAMIIMKGWRESDEKERAEWPKHTHPRAETVCECASSKVVLSIV